MNVAAHREKKENMGKSFAGEKEQKQPIDFRAAECCLSTVV